MRYPEGAAARVATADDLGFLQRMLHEAAKGSTRRWPSMDACLADPAVARFWRGWQRPGDLGVVVEVDGTAVGAAWARPLPGDELHPGEDPDVPLLVIAVEPAARCRGIGRMLLVALMVLASELHLTTIDCTVDATNGTALRLFQSIGFQERSRQGDAVHLRRRVRQRR